MRNAQRTRNVCNAKTFVPACNGSESDVRIVGPRSEKLSPVNSLQCDRSIFVDEHPFCNDVAYIDVRGGNGPLEMSDSNCNPLAVVRETNRTATLLPTRPQ